MIFLKNEMMMDDFKVAASLDIMWKLLEFEPDNTTGSNTNNSFSKPNIKASAQNIMNSS